jgi:DNA-binding NarL/FixJ family response regulator
VRLELVFLDADRAAPAPAALDERTCLTVLVAAAEADLRRYVRECLRERTDLRVIEAASVAGALALAERHPPELLVVDEPERAVLAAGSPFRAILLVDDVPHGASSTDPRLRLLARPFTAEELVAEVGRMIG